MLTSPESVLHKIIFGKGTSNQIRFSCIKSKSAIIAWTKFLSTNKQTMCKIITSSFKAAKLPPVNVVWFSFLQKAMMKRHK